MMKYRATLARFQQIPVTKAAIGGGSSRKLDHVCANSGYGAVVILCAGLFATMPRSSVSSEMSSEAAFASINFDALRAAAALLA
jgi:hypothetical protein